MIERALYNAALPLAAAAARVAGLFDRKIAAGLAGRAGLHERWRERAAVLDRRRRTVWFHVSSAGEFLQARPVIDLLAARHADKVQIALTFFSPSGMNFFRRHDRSSSNAAIVFADYLPLDTPANARFCLETLRPDLVVYVKFDLWPNLIIEAARAGIPQILISGTLSPGSWRLRRPAHRFYGSLYSKLYSIAAITDEDAARFAGQIAGTTRVFSAGDTRFDQVCARYDNPSTRIPSAFFDDARRILIAGSTWPRDEAVVIPGFARLLRGRPETMLVLAPHEPSPKRLREIDRGLRRAGLERVLLSGLGAGPTRAPVVVADGVGYLADLYRTGSAAYVGGSWTSGVHNVMEPAVAGLPVLFGPKIDNSWEAGRLVALGAGRIVRTPEEFAAAAGELLANEDLRSRLGDAASRFIRSGCGAARRCAEMIEQRLGPERTPGD